MDVGKWANGGCGFSGPRAYLVSGPGRFWGWQLPSGRMLVPGLYVMPRDAKGGGG